MLHKKCNISKFSFVKAKYLKFGTDIFMSHKSLWIKKKLSSWKDTRPKGFYVYSITNSGFLEAFCALVVVHSSNSSCSRPQDIRLAIPPDLADDPFSLLQPLCTLQLLSWSKNVHTQGAVWLAGMIPNRDFCDGQWNRGLSFFPFLILIIIAFLVFHADVF